MPRRERERMKETSFLNVSFDSQNDYFTCTEIYQNIFSLKRRVGRDQSHENGRSSDIERAISIFFQQTNTQTHK
jgi:hypothetical protein